MHIEAMRVNMCGLGTDPSAYLFRCGASLHGEAEVNPQALMQPPIHPYPNPESERTKERAEFAGSKP